MSGIILDNVRRNTALVVWLASDEKVRPRPYRTLDVSWEGRRVASMTEDECLAVLKEVCPPAHESCFV